MDYDVVVIGAGIHGAAVAQAAAAAGYRTLVLEHYDRAALGTSGRSSKLIHGGLRYLESARFRLVRECLAERKRLLKNAPHLVRLVPFHIPVYGNTQRNPWIIRLGLSLYTLLGGKGFTTIGKSQWSQLDGLRSDGLKAVFRYYDAQTDDAALTRAVLASAVSLGAQVEYSSSFTAANCDQTGCVIEYQREGVITQLRSRTLVNAAGPWVTSVLKRIEPRPRALAMELVQGAHLIIPGKLRQGMYYLEAPQDRRAVFVMPWQDHILLGTTETVFTGDPACVEPLQNEISYLLEVYNHYFYNRVERSQLIDAFAGLRVLPRSADPAYRRSRDTLLHVDEQRCPRVLSIYGGKLTSYRLTGERVVGKLQALLPATEAVADTRTLRLAPE